MGELKHFKQTSGYCGPAVLKIVLGSYGFDRSEKWYAEKLCAKRCGCNLITKARMGKIKSWGFEMNYEKESSLERVAQLNNEGVPVIAYVSEDELKTDKKVGHYLVIYDVRERVHIIDPLLDRKSWRARKTIENMWYDPASSQNPIRREILIIRPEI